jgi:integrase
MNGENDLARVPGVLISSGQVANGIAAGHVFSNFRSRKARNTLRRQDADLALFSAYLAELGLQAGDLGHEAQAWQGITWGLVEGFIRWQLLQGYAVQSINIRLSTVKVYAKHAMKAEAISTGEFAMIRAVDGFSQKEAKRVDEKRQDEGLATRKGIKKAVPVSINQAQARRLKDQPNTPQGRRDALIMALMLDHGLRVGEVARLTVSDFKLKEGHLVFYRPKVNRTQVHSLTADTLRAARAYFNHDAPAVGIMLRASRRNGRLDRPGMKERAITARVCTLGAAIGLDGLSAHDCRHYWVTTAARNGTQLDRLQDAGGWSSPAMPLRYIEAAKIANQGVRMGEGG